MTPTMRIGMIGLDTSHCPTFTRLLNDESQAYYVPGARVVGAYPGGSDAFSLSYTRVQGFTDQLRGEFGVEIYDSIPALAENVDAILLESSDGRQHLAQFAEAAVGKPVFLDKPLATTTGDARRILTLAEETGTPIMSCSSLRYAAGIADLTTATDHVVACEAFGPAPLLDDFPGLFWYGVHSAEVLVSKMGPGCKQVRCIEYPDTDVVIGAWRDGRVGMLRGTRQGAYAFGCIVHTEDATRCGLAQSTPPYYAAMLHEIIAFLQTGLSPIDIRETWDVIAFLEAAEQSRHLGGEPVDLAAI
jgi:hypothetical protein